MLPNKIYAGFDENTHLESYCTEKKGKCQTEYVRKDLLEMEFLRGVWSCVQEIVAIWDETVIARELVQNNNLSYKTMIKLQEESGFKDDVMFNFIDGFRNG